MQSLEPTYKNTNLNRYWLILFSFELLVFLSSFFFSYKIAIVLGLAIVFIFLVSLELKVTLIILIALSSLITYDSKSALTLGISLLVFILLALLFKVFIRFCLRGIKIVKTKLNLPLVIFLIIVLLNALRGMFCSYKITSLALESYVYLSFGLIFILINFLRSIRDIWILFTILVLFSISQSIFGITNYLLAGHRIGGTLFGIIPSLVAIVLLNLFLYSRNKQKRWFYLLLLIPLVVHLIFSFTRGYWFGFLGGLIFSYAYYISQQKAGSVTQFFSFLKRLGVVICFSIVILITLQLVLPGNIFIREFAKRFRSSFSASLSRETVSNYARVVEYREAVEKIKIRPILGYGLGYRFDFFNPLALSRESTSAVHNDYLAIILKMGLVGLMVFLWLFYVFFKDGFSTSRRLSNPINKGLTIGLIANVLQLLLIGFTNHVLIGIMNTYYLAFAIGAVLNIGKAEERISIG